MRSTPLGGSGFDAARGLALNSDGDVWLAGFTDSPDFRLVNPFQPDLAGPADAFVSRLTLTFTEPAPNAPPIAAAGDDQAILTDGCGRDVLLDGSLSSDPDGDRLQFTWSSDFFTETGPTMLLGLPPGSYTFTLTVSDGCGGTASDAVNVTVIDNVPPQIGTSVPRPAC